MEWIESIQRAIQAMEEHLLEEDTRDTAARAALISPFYLERGFKIMTGFSMGEYIRCRRLYRAALEVITGDEKILDLAFRYGYDTPESFTKAFSRFHGCSPAQLKKNPKKIRVFLPLKIHITVQGGNEMDFTVEKVPAFSVIGYEKEFDAASSYEEIPKFWDEIYAENMPWITGKEKPEDMEKQVFIQNRIGEYGVCVDDGMETGHFRYLIAGKWQGGEIPQGMVTYDFPELLWAKFPCTGPLPGALQSVNTKIFREWLPNNPQYEIAISANIEWYSAQGTPEDADYQSAIWIPVKERR